MIDPTTHKNLGTTDDGIFFDSWRQDIWVADEIWRSNVLFVRALRDDIAYHCPVWNEELVEEAKNILAHKVRMHG